MTDTAKRVARKLQIMAQGPVNQLAIQLQMISAPPALRATVLEEMARYAMTEAARYRGDKP